MLRGRSICTKIRPRSLFLQKYSIAQTQSQTPIPNVPKATSKFKVLTKKGLKYIFYGSLAYTGALVLFEDFRNDQFFLHKQCYRFSSACLTTSAIIIDYKWSLMGLSGDSRAKELHNVHRRSAERLLKYFEKMGGLFIKAGQHIYSLDYVLPYEYVVAMRPLHDKAPTVPYEAITKVFVEQFGQSPEQIFDSFQKEPVASASLAQVHKARIGTTELAVKVQYPGLQRQCWSDVWTITVLVRAIDRIFSGFSLSWLVQEFNRNLPNELDFRIDAKNNERLARNMQSNPRVATPKIYWNLTTSSVLTMEFIDGVKPVTAELEKSKFDSKEVAQLINECFCQQIFEHGWLHADPHPGNVLVRRDAKGRPQVVLLDHGLYCELPSGFRLAYAEIWMAILKGDEAAMRRAANGLGSSTYQLLAGMLTARTWESVLTSKGKEVVLDATEKQRIQQGAEKYFFEILKTLSDVPRELLMVMKTNDLLRAMNRDLNSTLNAFGTLGYYSQKTLNKEEQRLHPGLWEMAKGNCRLLSLSIKVWLAKLFLRLE